MTSDILTVTGPISPKAIGPTLPHEHLCSDLSLQSGREDNRMTDAEAMIQEMACFRAAGGRTIIEVTPEGVGRDVEMLRVISQSSGVQIVSGISFYDRSTWPEWVTCANNKEIADYFVCQIEEGDHGVYAGIIGELTSHNELGLEPQPQRYRLDENELKLFQAAAQAQRRTGTGITTHASLGRGGHAQLNALEDAGADLSRVAIGHCDAHWHQDPDKDMAYYLPILNRGAFCEFDLIGWADMMPDDVRADRIVALVNMGFAEHILLSTDTCRQSQLHVKGGRGFDFLWTEFLPRLHKRGVTEFQIEAMMVTAPRKLLGGK